MSPSRSLRCRLECVFRCGAVDGALVALYCNAPRVLGRDLVKSVSALGNADWIEVDAV